MSPAETVTETCSCGNEVTRPKLTGRFASLVGPPVLCDSCTTDLDRHREEDERRVEADAQAALAQRRLDASGLPKGLQQHRLVDLATDNGRGGVLQDARDLIAGRFATLTLVGPVGTGKTTIAAAVLLELLPARVRWVSVPGLLSQLDLKFGSEDRDRALRVLQGKDALVLDDLDKARPSEQAAMHLFTAIDSRITHRAPLIVTANLKPSELAARWPQPHGNAIVSRLVGGRVREVGGQDRRLTGGGR